MSRLQTFFKKVSLNQRKTAAMASYFSNVAELGKEVNFLDLGENLKKLLQVFSCVFKNISNKSCPIEHL